jgi:hypothetical protein
MRPLYSTCEATRSKVPLYSHFTAPVRRRTRTLQRLPLYSAGADLLLYSGSTAILQHEGAALQPLYSFSTAALQPLYSFSTAALQPLYSFSTAALQLLYSFSTAALRPLYSLSTAALQLLYNRSTAPVEREGAVLALYSSCHSTAQTPLVLAYSGFIAPL